MWKTTGITEKNQLWTKAKVRRIVTIVIWQASDLRQSGADGRRGLQGLVEDLQIVDTIAAKFEAQPQPEETFERTAPIVGEQTKLIF